MPSEQTSFVLPNNPIPIMYCSVFKSIAPFIFILQAFSCLSQNVKINHPAPEIALPGMLGDTISLSTLKKKGGLILVDFWASWCMPCLMLGSVIEEIAEEKKDALVVKKLNVDENQQTSTKYQVMSIPTVILFKDGEPVETFIGVQPKNVYTDAIEKYSK